MSSKENHDQVQVSGGAELTELNETQVFETLKRKYYNAQTSYVLMYSTWWGGVVRSPHLWMVPFDDHLVHRGDGVFEAIKARYNGAWLLDAHLTRLQNSAEKLGIKPPFSMDEQRNIILQCLRMSGLEEAVVRVFLSRGPGYFSANPADSIGSQYYVAITKYTPLAERNYTSGVRIGKSQVAVKPDWFPQVKSCNYLPNVLMKKESVERGLDFTVGFTAEGLLTESATENIMLVNEQGELCTPSEKTILKGTTMFRACELLKRSGFTHIKHNVALTEQDLLIAKEVMIVGTTLDVLPVAEYEGRRWSSVGTLTKKIQQLIWNDQKPGSETHSPYGVFF